MVSTSITTRRAFRRGLDISTAHIHVRSVQDMTGAEQAALVSVFNRYGFAILDCDPHPEPRRNSLALRDLFGAPVWHDRADEDGVVPIDSSLRVAGYIGSSSEEHPPHTDGAFADRPEKIMTLRCEIAARTGGDSFVCSAKAAHDHLSSTMGARVNALFAEDACTIARNDRWSTKPVLRWVAGRIHIAYRYDDVVRVTCRPDVVPVYAELRAFFLDPANRVTFALRPHQILVVDNAGLVHGRTAFPAGEPRRLHRLNFDATGPLCRQMQIGFLPETRTGLALPRHAPSAGRDNT